MRHSLIQSTVVAWVLLGLAGVSFGQGGTTSVLAGVVVDTSGGVIPGADVVAKHNATGVTTSAVTNADGLFSFPALNTGTYTVTVSLQGFKTYISNDVVLTSGTGANLRVVLGVGVLQESVTVSSQSEIVQTQSSTITTTINTNQVQKLPLTSRSAMDFVPFMPGVTTPNGNRNSSINGLPRGTINITLDGVNIQDNTLRSTDGFFAIVSPRLDAIEEVTVQTAAQGADSGGQGAVQVKFVTRSGSNDFVGSGYYYYRSDKLNANTWFNNRNGNEKAALLQNQSGVRLGGPILHNKAFFFVNYEEFRQPSDTSRQRVLLNTQAQQGLFTYTSGGVTRTVDLLQLAALNGQTSSPDPTMVKMLSDIRNSTTVAGGVTTIDANLDRLTFNNHVETVNRFPTFRVDVNLTDRHRFSSSLNYQRYNTFPDTLNNRDPSFPGFPAAAGQTSQRIGFSNWMRSTFTNHLVNEARVGFSSAPVQFFAEFSAAQLTGAVANSNGLRFNFPSVGQTLQSPSNTLTPSSRNATSLLVEDNVTWLKGAHSFTMGGSFTQYTLWAQNQTLVPSVTFAVTQGDPALAMFNASTFPGASATQLTAAQNLYALVTGRIQQFTAEARIDEDTGNYSYLGASMQRARMPEWDAYIQDQWRIRPNLTINAGLRYGLQLPFYPLNDSYTYAGLEEICGVSGVAADGGCNVFSPGIRGGRTVLPQYEAGTAAYNVDRNNFAPSVGMVWTPEQRAGFLGRLMGRAGDFVIRGGYARHYSRAGLNDFSTPFGNNTGLTLSLTRTPTTFMLLRDEASLTQPSFATTPAYPITPSLTSSVNGFDPNIQVPSADSFSVGVQRALNSNTSVEARYVGTRGHDSWQVVDYNEIDIFDNGFVNEFRTAQANLRANIAAGRGNTFAYTGVPGTSPLPIFLAYLSGVNSTQAADPSRYAGGNWTNATLLGFLASRNPQPFAFGCFGLPDPNVVASYGCTNNNRQNGFIGNATFRANAAAAGLPANFFIANPDALAGANVTRNQGSTRYNAMQLELRRRLSGGVQAQASYVYGHQFASNFLTLRRPLAEFRNTGDPGDITHTFKLNLVYDLPFGRDHRIGSGAGAVVDRIIGGWQLGVASIVRSGELVDLGNVRLAGMTREEAEAMFQVRYDAAGRHVYMLPQDVIDQTINAFNVSATSANGYGGTPPTGQYFAPVNGPDCIEVDPGARFGECDGVQSLVVTGPLFRQTDITFMKRTKIAGRSNFQFGFNILNAFNQPNFVPLTRPNGCNCTAAGIGGTNVVSNFEVTSLAGTNTSRLIEVVTRFNW